MCVSSLSFHWSSAAELFPVLGKVVALDAYREAAVLGLVVSVGGLTESLVRWWFAFDDTNLISVGAAQLARICGRLAQCIAGVIGKHCQ